MKNLIFAPWRAAKKVQNPMLRLLAMALAGYVGILLWIPIFMLRAFFHRDPYQDAYDSGYSSGFMDGTGSR